MGYPRYRSTEIAETGNSARFVDMPLIVKKLKSSQETEAVRLLRMRVFVDEQGVPPEVEMDEFDDVAIHAIAYKSGLVVGTGRLILDTDTDARIGRMAVNADLRRTGVGAAVLAFLENEARSHGIKLITLHAQNYVKNFYAKYGYQERGNTFFEAGILHIEMIKNIE